MFSLTIVFGPGPMVWTLMFKTEDKLREEMKNWAMHKTPLIDDFGQEACVEVEKMHGYMIEELEQSKLAHIERALHQTRVKVKADEMARADPVIRAAAMQGGSGILQPAMPGMPQPNGGWRG